MKSVQKQSIGIIAAGIMGENLTNSLKATPPVIRPKAEREHSAGTNHSNATNHSNVTGIISATAERVRHEFASFVDRQEKNCPRTFNLLFFVFIPIVLLIFWCMFCGHFLAVLEHNNEMKDNSDAISAFVKEYESTRQKLELIKELYNDCHDQYIRSSPPSDLSNLKSFMATCSEGSTTEFLLTFEQEKLDLLKSEGLSFNWNTCNKEKKSAPYEVQAKYLISVWNETAEDVLTEYKASTPVEDQIYDEMYALVDEAYETSSIPDDACFVNSSGGSIFWFTVMT